jgi:hypothetical protein
VGLDPGDVPKVGILFEDHRLKLVLLFDQSQSLDHKLAIKTEPTRIILDAIIYINALETIV